MIAIILFPAEDNPAAEAEPVVGRVDNAELSGGDALHGLFGLDNPQAVGCLIQFSRREFGCVPYFEAYVDGVFRQALRQRRFEQGFSHKAETAQAYNLAVLGRSLKSFGNVEDVLRNVFFDNIPRAAAQTESLALPDGVEPKAVVVAEAFACFLFDNGADFNAEIAPYKVVVIDFAQKADALAVFAGRAGKFGFFGNGAHFVFHEAAHRKHEFGKLGVAYLPQKVGLILYRVLGRAQKHRLFGLQHLDAVFLHGLNIAEAVVLIRIAHGGDVGLLENARGGVMPGGDAVEILAVFFFESPELDEFVAHHVGIGREAAFYGVDGVFDHVVPVFAVQGHDFEAAAVFLGDVGGQLDILLARAVDKTVLLLHADADIENIGLIPHLLEAVNHHRRVHPSGNQSCDACHGCIFPYKSIKTFRKIMASLIFWNVLINFGFGGQQKSRPL